MNAATEAAGWAAGPGQETGGRVSSSSSLRFPVYGFVGVEVAAAWAQSTGSRVGLALQTHSAACRIDKKCSRPPVAPSQPYPPLFQ